MCFPVGGFANYFMLSDLSRKRDNGSVPHLQDVK